MPKLKKTEQQDTRPPFDVGIRHLNTRSLSSEELKVLRAILVTNQKKRATEEVMGVKPIQWSLVTMSKKMILDIIESHFGLGNSVAKQNLSALLEKSGIPQSFDACNDGPNNTYIDKIQSAILNGLHQAMQELKIVTDTVDSKTFVKFLLKAKTNIWLTVKDLNFNPSVINTGDSIAIDVVHYVNETMQQSWQQMQTPPAQTDMPDTTLSKKSLLAPRTT
jgi:hypothetical protein